MEMTLRQKELFQLGKKAKQITGDVSYSYAIEILCYDDSFGLDLIDDIAMSKYSRFFKAGFEDTTPQYRQGYRYGEIPECGYSTNWSTGEREKGVSCTCLIGGNHENDTTIYDYIYPIQGTKKIKISGWYFGDYGSDGEPLLIDAKKVNEDNEILTEYI